MPLPRNTWAVALALLLPCLVAQGAESIVHFSAGWEPGSLLVTESPAGEWDARIDHVGVTLEAVPAAAHSGNTGFRLTDTHSSSIDDGESGWIAATNRLSPSSEYRIRFWFRASVTEGGDDIVVAYLATPDFWALELRYDPVSHAFSLAGHDVLGSFFESPDIAPAAAATGDWYLVEGVVSGLGTLQGETRMFVNGKQIGHLTGFNFNTTQRLTTIALGEAFAEDKAFRGTLDFDDLRVSPSPQASRISVQAAAKSSGCHEVDVVLLDSETGAKAPAPYPIAATLEVTGASGTFFTDSGCTTPATSVVLAQDEERQRVYFQATSPGAATLAAKHVDFVSESASLPLSGSVTAPGSVGLVVEASHRSKLQVSTSTELSVHIENASEWTLDGLQLGLSLERLQVLEASLDGTAISLHEEANVPMQMPPRSSRTLRVLARVLPGQGQPTFQARVLNPDGAALAGSEPLTLDVERYQVGLGCTSGPNADDSFPTTAATLFFAGLLLSKRRGSQLRSN